jgi:very-short-patch-repair endonuclease
MDTAYHDQLFAIFSNALFNSLIQYGLPALAVCALLTYISTRFAPSRRRQRKSSPSRHQRSEPAPLSTVPVRGRRPLTAFEQQMYGALVTALPECVILAQVAFSALLTTDGQSHRNRFDRKVADFVVCSRRMTPIAVIELDDSSHRNKSAADAQRDAMLRNAGLTTLRYQSIPAAEAIRHDIEQVLAALTLALPTADTLHDR